MTPPRRVERTGLPYPWIAFYSDDVGRLYYVHPISKERSWTKPVETSGSNKRNYAVAAASALPYPWIACNSKDAKIYYSNPVTEQSLWTRPETGDENPPAPEESLASTSNSPEADPSSSAPKSQVNTTNNHNGDVSRGRRSDNKGRDVEVTSHSNRKRRQETGDSEYKNSRSRVSVLPSTSKGKSYNNRGPKDVNNKIPKSTSVPLDSLSSDKPGREDSRRSPKKSSRRTTKETKERKVSDERRKSNKNGSMKVTPATDSASKNKYDKNKRDRSKSAHPISSIATTTSATVTHTVFHSPINSRADGQIIDHVMEVDVSHDSKVRGSERKGDRSVLPNIRNTKARSVSNPTVFPEGCVVSVVCDTSALIEYPGVLHRLVEYDLTTVIPERVQRELDSIKGSNDKSSLTKNAARSVCSLLRDMTSELSSKYASNIVLESRMKSNEHLSGFDLTCNDDYVLKCAINLQHELSAQYPCVKIVLLTYDNIFAVRANSHGIIGADLPQFIDAWEARGWKTPDVDKDKREKRKREMGMNKGRRDGDSGRETSSSSSSLPSVTTPRTRRQEGIRKELKDLREKVIERVELFEKIMRDMSNELIKRFHTPNIHPDVINDCQVRMKELRNGALRVYEDPTQTIFNQFISSVNKCYKYLEGPADVLEKIYPANKLFRDIQDSKPGILQDLYVFATDSQFDLVEDQTTMYNLR